MENQTNLNNSRKRQRTNDDVKFLPENIEDEKCEEHGPEPNQEHKHNASNASACNFHTDFGYSSLLYLLQTIPIFPHLHNQFGPALLCVNLFMKFFFHL